MLFIIKKLQNKSSSGRIGRTFCKTIFIQGASGIRSKPFH